MKPNDKWPPDEVAAMRRRKQQPQGHFLTFAEIEALMGLEPAEPAEPHGQPHGQSHGQPGTPPKKGA